MRTQVSKIGCPERRSFGKVSPARCHAAGSLRKALKCGFTIVSLEFRLRHYPVFSGGNCASLREEFEKEWKVGMSNAGHFSFRRRTAMNSAYSSMKRLFDAQCSCDNHEGPKEEWKERMGRPRQPVVADWCHDPLWILKRRIRELCSGWGSRLVEARRGGLRGEWHEAVGVVPDQQGCLETPTRYGGTLGTSTEEESPEDNLVRVGSAKTKGKVRVVTMQSARVKRVLSPVHDALYSHLSQFGWLVRGEVTKSDFLAVAGDRRADEKHVSGDYEQATNLINQHAVEAIVSVIAEDGELSEEERSVLLGSFSNLQWINPCTGTRGPINWGSMMGNLVSFPLLCLLNKACFDICTDITFGPGEKRIARFNGDDCMFNATPQFYQLWRSVTSTFGLKVNESKTSFTNRYIELNSRTFECRTSRIVRKPVLSFLRRVKDVPDDLLSDIFRGISTFRSSVIWWVITEMRYEVSIRPISIDNIPQAWRKSLLRRRWFRDSLRRDPPPLLTSGKKRSVKTVIGPPPLPRFYPLVTRMVDDCTRDFVSQWKGRKVAPYERRIDRRALRADFRRLPPAFVRRGGNNWAFLWPKKIWEWLHEDVARLRILAPEPLTKKRWYDDHPLLHPVQRILVEPLRSEVRKLNFRPLLPEHAVRCASTGAMRL